MQPGAERSKTLPLPPLEYRTLVGPTDEVHYDNPTGTRIWGDLDYGPLVPGEAYRSVFDFGCGCGRAARQLMMQANPPGRYVGVDINADMINWCTANLASETTTFHFHDVWNLTYAPDNARNAVQPLRGFGEGFTLINVHSVFTHTYAHQTAYYLEELKAMLSKHGLIRSTWFFFNREWFPVLSDDQHCLFVNELDPTQAVYYDWSFVVDTLRQLGLRVVDVNWTELPGYQSELFLAASDAFEDIVDRIEPPDSVLGFGAGRPPA